MYQRCGDAFEAEQTETIYISAGDKPRRSQSCSALSLLRVLTARLGPSFQKRRVRRDAEDAQSLI